MSYSPRQIAYTHHSPKDGEEILPDDRAGTIRRIKIDSVEVQHLPSCTTSGAEIQVLAMIDPFST